jgi:HEPN domain-containing protein
MKDQAEGIRWLAHAQDEYEDADTLRRMGRFYLALFHYQQATEKALKAFLLSASGSAEVLRIPSVQDLIEGLPNSCRSSRMWPRLRSWMSTTF